MEHKEKIKPVITLSCLPGDLTEERLREIHRALVEAMEDSKIFGIHGEESIICLFAPDMMRYGLGTEVVVEGKWFPEDGTLEKDWSELAYRVGKAVQSLFQHSFVQCILRGFGAERGFWTSPIFPPEKKS
jgi:hypothetical protein